MNCAEGRGQFSYQPWNSRAGPALGIPRAGSHLHQQFTVSIGRQVWIVFRLTT